MATKSKFSTKRDNPLEGYEPTKETLRGILKDSYQSHPELNKMFEGFSWDFDPGAVKGD